MKRLGSVAMDGEGMTSTKKIRLLRPVLLKGEHAEQCSVHELPLEEADWLIAQGSAEPLGVVARIIDRIITPTHRDTRPATQRRKGSRERRANEFPVMTLLPGWPVRSASRAYRELAARAGSALKSLRK